MPELPEVEMARRYLEKTSLHQIIEEVEVRDARILSGVSADVLTQSLSGLRFRLVRRHGKWLFMELKKDLWLALHLGMTGNPVFLLAHEKEPGHARLVIYFKDGTRLAYSDTRMLGEVTVIESPQHLLSRRKIGPDVLELDRSSFLDLMCNRRGIVKSALLNQRLVAGLGNLYVDEALFQAGICPDAKGLSEKRLERLFACIQSVLRTVIACQVDFSKLPESYLLPHRYPGGECPRDGTPLEYARIAGRTSYFCPLHQHR